MTVLLITENIEFQKNLVKRLNGLGFKIDCVSPKSQTTNKLEPLDEVPFNRVLWDIEKLDADTSALNSWHEMNRYRLGTTPILAMVEGDNYDRVRGIFSQVDPLKFIKVMIRPSYCMTVQEVISLRGVLYRALEQVSIDPAGEEIKGDINDLSKAQLLLVEDNEINQEIVVNLLDKKVLSIAVVSKGQEALDILKRQSFDGILMDCHMPVMDGYQATQKIRAQKKYQDLPIIALTGNAMVSNREEVLAAGMNDLLTKPFVIDHLLKTLSKWIV